MNKQTMTLLFRPYLEQNRLDLQKLYNQLYGAKKLELKRKLIVKAKIDALEQLRNILEGSIERMEQPLEPAPMPEQEQQ